MINLGALITAQVPDLTEEEVTDLYLLRKEYGISAKQAWMEMPAWEVQLLLAAARPEEFKDEEEVTDPFDMPPANLDKLLTSED